MKKDNIAKPITYSDDFHCIASKKQCLGHQFKTIYSVDVKYRHRIGNGKTRMETLTCDYGNYKMASIRFDLENSSKCNPSNMNISRVVLRSTTYLKGKKMGSEILRRVSYDHPELFDVNGSHLYVAGVGYEEQM